MKMNNDKITSLYEQKSKFLESEITAGKINIMMLWLKIKILKLK